LYHGDGLHGPRGYDLSTHTTMRGYPLIFSPTLEIDGIFTLEKPIHIWHTKFLEEIMNLKKGLHYPLGVSTLKVASITTS